MRRGSAPLGGVAEDAEQGRRAVELRRPPPRCGVSPNTSRVMANAGVATEAEAVRAEAAEIMLCDHDGDMDVLLAPAHDLVLVHPRSRNASWASSNTPPRCARPAARAAWRTTFLRQSTPPRRPGSAHRGAPPCPGTASTSALPSLPPPPSLLFPHGRGGSAAGRDGGAARRWGPAARRLVAVGA
jgi:hypothetical protein